MSSCSYKDMAKKKHKLGSGRTAAACSSGSHTHLGPVHKGVNHIPKAVSDRDPLPDWVCVLNCVRSQA